MSETLQLYGLYVYHVVTICDFGMLKYFKENVFSKIIITFIIHFHVGRHIQTNVYSTLDVYRLNVKYLYHSFWRWYHLDEYPMVSLNREENLAVVQFHTATYLLCNATHQAMEKTNWQTILGNRRQCCQCLAKFTHRIIVLVVWSLLLL